MKRSLRTQISVWIALSILIVVIATVFVTQQVTVWSLERSIDDDIQKRAYMVSSVISSDITTDEESYARVITDLASQELSFVPSLLRVLSPEGKPITEFGEMNGTTIEALDKQLLSSDIGTGRFDTIEIAGLEPLRAFTISVPDPRTRQRLAMVQVIEPLRQVDGVKRELWRNGIIAGSIGTVLAVFVGQLVIRRGFRPLGRIVEAIDKFDYGHLTTGMQKGGSPAELEQLAKSLSAMWRRLDAAASERRRAVGSMSHGLRTPLTAVQGQLEVLLSQPSLSSETRDSVERMLKETRRLARLVKNMLLNAQLGSNPSIEMEEVHLNDLLEEVVGDMWVLAGGLGIVVSSAEDVFVLGNRDLLKQMLVDIVDNAVKFTPSNGKVELALTAEEYCAVLRVSDTGCGIPAEYLPHVMEPFSRVGPSRTTTREGTKLGLSIVKQIVELHRGQIKIDSQVGVGTSVIVRLPMSGMSFPKVG